MTRYELMTIFFPEIGEEAIAKELEELKKYISSNEGDILHEDSWGNRDLAYRIKKQEQGFYHVLNFTLNPIKLGEMQRSLVINPSVIRALIVKTPEKYIFRTFAEYQEEEEKAKALKEEAKRNAEAKKAGNSAPRIVRKPKFEKPEKHEKPEPKKHVPEETKEEEKPIKKAESAPKIKKIASPKIKLEEVDAKLKSIIDDPDITL
ncbi:30S ribosomal protein S6 [Candidatus Peregrinibacteria bacterium]|nr:30S ribosomal protein S6 [Candidatus Peregrinibacteria bacterium]